MTNKEYYEETAEMGLDDMFFRYNNINPDEEYKDENKSQATKAYFYIKNQRNKMSKYVMSDIHGEYDKFLKCLN